MIDFYGREPHGWGLRMHMAVFQFPGGETHIKVPEGIPANSDWYAVVKGADPQDLITLGMWASLAKEQGKRAYALIPYLPGARADRGIPFGAGVYAGIINSFGLDGVVCVDPHSEIMPGLINNLITVDHTDLVLEGVSPDPLRYVGVIAPDKGARPRALAVAERMGIPLFQAEKERDFNTGKLSGFHCESLPRTGNLLVVDDICDGGGTFMGLADASGLLNDRLDLWVTHGVFSGNAPGLRNNYGRIMTTNSHPGATRAGVATDIVPVLPHLLHAIDKKENA